MKFFHKSKNKNMQIKKEPEETFISFGREVSKEHKLKETCKHDKFVDEEIIKETIEEVINEKPDPKYCDFISEFKSTFKNIDHNKKTCIVCGRTNEVLFGTTPEEIKKYERLYNSYNYKIRSRSILNGYAYLEKIPTGELLTESETNEYLNDISIEIEIEKEIEKARIRKEEGERKIREEQEKRKKEIEAIKKEILKK